MRAILKFRKRFRGGAKLVIGVPLAVVTGSLWWCFDDAVGLGDLPLHVPYLIALMLDIYTTGANDNWDE